MFFAMGEIRNATRLERERFFPLLVETKAESRFSAINLKKSLRFAVLPNTDLAD
jgi:hypothetical protein